jgi:hypothetical protein
MRSSDQLPSHTAWPLAALLLLLGGFLLTSPPVVAEGPGAFRLEEPPGQWASLFRAQLDTRLSHSFQEDRELEGRISQVWEALMARLGQRPEQTFDPFQQYPVLGLVDDQFYVMKYRAPGGRESYVVRAEAEPLREAPTLGSTLRSYLQELYQALGEIAEEQVARMGAGEAHHPDFDALMEQNPYQHGEPIPVPDMGSFRNRALRFTGLGGRLEARDLEAYERLKAQVEAGQGLQVGRAHRWGLAVETAELVKEGSTVCRYRTVREVAVVRDRFVGEGRVGALLREPRLGTVLEVSACVEGCEAPENWHRLYPEEGQREERERRPRSPRRSSPEMPRWEGASPAPGVV